jgi:hypothetical protein
VQIDELDSVCPGTSSNSCVQKGLPEVDDFLAGAHFVLLEHVSTEPPHLRRLNHWIHPNSQYLDYFNGATLSQVDESPDGSQGACNAAASMEPPFFGVDESRAGQDHLRRDAASTGPPSPRWMNRLMTVLWVSNSGASTGPPSPRWMNLPTSQSRSVKA